MDTVDHIPTTRGIYNALRHEVVTLRRKAGTRLSENEIAARFGTSREPHARH